MNIPAIRKDISKKTLRAVGIASVGLEEIMDECIDVYYFEFSPDYYVRTGIFGESPETGTPVSVGLGAMIDMSYIDRGGHKFSSKSKWNDSIVFHTSIAGQHGGFVGGTNVWFLTLNAFSSRAKPILISALAAAGL